MRVVVWGGWVLAAIFAACSTTPLGRRRLMLPAPRERSRVARDPGAAARKNQRRGVTFVHGPACLW
jgi:hypothetical protein